MKKTLALLGCVFATACAKPVDLRKDAKQQLVTAANKVQQLMAAGNLAAVIKQIPDDLFPGGSRAKARTSAEMNAPKGVAELAKHMTWDPPGHIYRVGSRHVCVISYQSLINGQTIRASQIGVSSDGGATWGLISGSTGGIAGLRKTAPLLLKAIEDDIKAVTINGTSKTSRKRNK